MKAADYAKALYEVRATPEHLKGLKQALTRRGHIKLLPHIFAEYQKLELKERRLKKQKEITPEQERTRILLELYRKLVSTSA